MTAHSTIIVLIMRFGKKYSVLREAHVREHHADDFWRVN